MHQEAITKYCAYLHHTLSALKLYPLASLVVPLPKSEQINQPSSNHIYTKSTPYHIHHHYAPSVTLTHTTHIISSTTPTYAPHCHPWICGQSPPEQGPTLSSISDAASDTTGIDSIFQLCHHEEFWCNVFYDRMAFLASTSCVGCSIQNKLIQLHNLCAQLLHKTQNMTFYRPLVSSYDIPG